MRKSRVIIADTNQTVYLESLALNKPTIIYWNKNCNEIDKNAKPIFEDLEEVGIYQKSPVLAAKMLSKVYKNIDHWWLDHNTQIIRKRFLSKYVALSDNWRFEWENLLRNIIIDEKK